MLSSIVILSTLAVSALGNNTTGSSYSFPAGFDIGQVKTSELNSWCQGQRNVCPHLCESGTKQNNCDSSTLKFSCVCQDDSTPDVSDYIQTVPFYVCQATFGQCIAAHPDDADGQENCKKQSHCGSKNATASDTTSSSAVASSTTMAVASSSSSSSEASPTASESAAATTTDNAAAALGGMQGISTGLMASVMFLAARLVL
ncbi:hypothetical protein N7492_003673 [Penicillium capsulatum]|uniref:DUF7707 domain-containing protein n=1 Tax=Penicillium capsulatum TaxID=69766 RepID=A0A9W9IJV3_9EURO|nr:hypothetical protein N7492_003673 [Penicillium capsulatum]KAJ6121746.1 hypothetical protein N7512_004211 [Penicillium capsulatum]